jgi:hypothetical protein
MGGMTRTRFLAAAAGAAVLVGAVIMLAALVAAPGPWWRGYVSEAGTAGQRFAVAYRCGLLLLALGVALLGAALARQPARGGRSAPVRRPGGLVATLLGIAAAMAGTSGAVSCSDRCPLPPFEPTTVADVVHTAAGIVGMVMLAAAMLAVSVLDARPALRRLAATGAAFTVPLGLALAATMFLVGRGTLGAVLERVLLVVAVSWLIGASSVVTVTAGAGPGRRWTAPSGPGRIR